MKKKNLMLAGLISLVSLLLTVQIVLAHESVTAGNYEIEYGWINEPPIVGQRNAFVINIADTTAEGADIDVSNLTVKVSYGGQSKDLELQPLGEDTPGQFVAPILPTVAGVYTLELGGKIGDTDVSISVEPEEVESADALQFPSVGQEAQSAGLGMSNIFAIAGFVFGLGGLVLGFVAYRKRS